ncbi:MAG TPA: type II toxin-antitoxin system VapC family toxin [Longimicrobiales bacterium]|nr:type II toxin-antitoxin system VapC family toxin [Longimicrobiales bacterium]
MAYLFDTDAISELLRPRPLPPYLDWLKTIPREEQFTSAVTVGELFKGAYRSAARQRHLKNIEERVLPAVTALPYDVSVARVFGKIRAYLEQSGSILPDADLQIAATALYHGLELVTGNLRHFERIPDLRLNRILADSRTDDA